MRRMAAERPPLILSKIHFAGWPYSTLLPGPWAAADGLCWHTSRESHPSEALSELPPLLDPGFTRGCGWTGVSLSDCWRGSGWVNQPQCETARHRLLCGRMGTALHLPWPSLMRAHGPHRWSWRILQRRLLFSKAPSGKYSDNRIFGFQGTSEKQFLLACIGEDVGILITLQFQFSKSFFNCLRMRTFRLWGWRKCCSKQKC